MTNKIHIITDRGITYSDSVSRYIIDTYRGLEAAGYQPTIFTTHESRLKVIDPELLDLRVENDLPEIEANAVYHFHLTFSIRQHTEFLLRNVEKLRHNSVVTFHVDPVYAEAMGQRNNALEILSTLAKHKVLTYVFSNYSKQNFEAFGYKGVFVLYPGLDLSIYKKYQNVVPENKVLFVASNPDNKFINEIKGAYLFEQLQEKFSNYTIVQKSNVPFAELMQAMAEAKFYLALGSYEHYGFAIIDAFNLGTIPIYNNAGGLVESVHGRGFPFYVRDREVIGVNNFEYDINMVSSNYWYTKVVHDLKSHITNLISLYKLLTPQHEPETTDASVYQRASGRQRTGSWYIEQI